MPENWIIGECGCPYMPGPLAGWTWHTPNCGQLGSPSTQEDGQ